MNSLGRILIEQMAQALIRGAVKELKDQGHVASGKGIASFEAKTKVTAKKLVADILVNDYLVELDKKQPPKVIPIPVLLKWSRYVKSQLQPSERLTFSRRVQFKVAKVGVPTPGAYRFTSNGRRTDWIEYGAKKAARDLRKLLENSEMVEKEIEKAIDEAEKRR